MCFSHSARQEEAAKRGTSRGTMGPGTIKAMGGGAASSGGQQEVMKVYLRNDSYKTIVVVRMLHSNSFALLFDL